MIGWYYDNSPSHLGIQMLKKVNISPNGPNFTKFMKKWRLVEYLQHYHTLKKPSLEHFWLGPWIFSHTCLEKHISLLKKRNSEAKSFFLRNFKFCLCEGGIFDRDSGGVGTKILQGLKGGLGLHFLWALLSKSTPPPQTRNFYLAVLYVALISQSLGSKFNSSNWLGLCRSMGLM